MHVDRTGLLRVGFAGALTAASAGLVTRGARAAGGLGDGDLAQARIVVAVELLAAAFYTRVLDAKLFRGDAEKDLRRALFNEQEHYRSVGDILTGAAQPVAQPGDFDYGFPAHAFESRGVAVELGVELESGFLGTYLGAVDAASDSYLKTTFARIACSEAEHLSVLARLHANRSVGLSFPELLDESHASAFLDTYLT